MKTDLNGVSQCPKGTENYETFYTMVRRKRTKLIQYDYRSEDGELFTCVKPTLTECRKARDEHFKPVVVVYTPERWQKRTPRLKKALIYICRRLGVLLRCGTKVKAIQQKLPGLITTQRTIILCWNLATGEHSVFAMVALRRWDIPGNFTGYSTPPLENVELNFCRTKPGAQSPGIII